MRLPFLSKAKCDQASACGSPQYVALGSPRLAEQSETVTTTSKKASAKARRKEEAKKAAWEREQERRRLRALARWEAALQEQQQEAAADPTQQTPDIVVSADARLERSRRSRRILNVDHLDELESYSDSDSDQEQEVEFRGDVYDDGPSTAQNQLAPPGGAAYMIGSSQAAQRHQVACMRELPMLEQCAKRHAPCSFFVDMLLLGETPPVAAVPAKRGRKHKKRAHRDEEGEDEEERALPRTSRVARTRPQGAELLLAKERASRSCPPSTRKEPKRN